MQLFKNDPLGFVLWAYPWGKPGPLEKYVGPNAWQADLLRQLRKEVRKRNFVGVTPVLPVRFMTSPATELVRASLWRDHRGSVSASRLL